VKPLRPFFHYYGAKWSKAKSYPEPMYPNLVEAFAGSAGYALRHWDRQVWLVEKDPVLIGVWDYLLRVSESEIMSLPLFTPGGPYEVDALGPLPQEAKDLIGFWVVVAVSSPGKKCGGWMQRKLELPQGTDGTAWGDTFWSARMRERIASQLSSIRHWRLYAGSYEDWTTDGPATWFVDPPYQKMGKHYKCHDIDYGHLAAWCQARQGQVIVCETFGADWLPFRSLGMHKSTKGKNHEAIWTK